MVRLPAPQPSSTTLKSASQVPVIAVRVGDRRDARQDEGRSRTKADLRAKVETRAFLLLLDRVGAFR